MHQMHCPCQVKGGGKHLRQKSDISVSGWAVYNFQINLLKGGLKMKLIGQRIFSHFVLFFTFSLVVFFTAPTVSHGADEIEIAIAPGVLIEANVNIMDITVHALIPYSDVVVDNSDYPILLCSLNDCQEIDDSFADSRGYLVARISIEKIDNLDLETNDYNTLILEGYTCLVDLDDNKIVDADGNCLVDEEGGFSGSDSIYVKVENVPQQNQHKNENSNK